MRPDSSLDAGVLLIEVFHSLKHSELFTELSPTMLIHKTYIVVLWNLLDSRPGSAQFA
jgi:hypothetical protein